MKVQKLDIVRFASKGTDSFYDAIISKVNSYFKTCNISPYANTEMWVKTAVMMSLYFIPYVLLVPGFAGNSTWIFFGLWFLMGWERADSVSFFRSFVSTPLSAICCPLPLVIQLSQVGKIFFQPA